MQALRSIETFDGLSSICGIGKHLSSMQCIRRDEHKCIVLDWVPLEYDCILKIKDRGRNARSCRQKLKE